MSLSKFRSSRLQSKGAFGLYPIALFLSLLGLAFIFESSSVVAFENYQNSFYFFNRQVLWLVISIIVYFFISKVPFLFWQKYSFPLLLLGIFAMVLVLVPAIGVKIGGARRWIDLGPFSFQPSEIIKFVSLIFLVSQIEGNRVEKNHLLIFWLGSSVAIFIAPLGIFAKVLGSIVLFSSLFFVSKLPNDKIKLASFCYLFCLLFFLTMAQPDMGTAITIATLLIGTYFLSGHHRSEIIFFLIAGIVLASALILSSPYRMERVMGFINPKSDPLDSTYHINQVLIGVSSGGLWGRGLFQSRQKYEFLPEAHTDSIFAIIAEETGIIGSIFIFSLYLLLLNNLKNIALQTNDKTKSLFVGGVFLLIASQALINLCAMTNLLPLTGIPLPFLSYGGTSLLTFALLLGITESIKSNI